LSIVHCSKNTTLWKLWHINCNSCEFIVVRNEVSVIGVATRLQTDQLRCYSILGWGKDFFLFFKVSSLVLGTAHPPIKWLVGAVTSGVKLLGHEADHSLSTSAKVKNAWNSYLHSPFVPSWHAKDNFTFYITEI
jgi:hypothetical protein